MFLSLLIYYLYKNTTDDMYHRVFMYDRRYRNTNSQANTSIKYMSNTHGYVTRNEIYCDYIMLNMNFGVCVSIFNR